MNLPTISQIRIRFPKLIVHFLLFNPSVHKVVGFYGSRIRQYTDVIPNAETILIFGEQEKSFNPIDLKTSLSAYPNVLINIVEGEHGFADPYTSKYNEQTTNDLSEYFFN